MIVYININVTKTNNKERGAVAKVKYKKNHECIILYHNYIKQQFCFLVT